MAAPTTNPAPLAERTPGTARDAELQMLRAYRDRLLGEVHEIERELERLSR